MDLFFYLFFFIDFFFFHFYELASSIENRIENLAVHRKTGGKDLSAAQVYKGEVYHKKELLAIRPSDR